MNKIAGKRFVDQQRFRTMTKENLADRHIHLHTHEVRPQRWLRRRSKIGKKFLSRLLSGVLLIAGLVGGWWLRWWR